MKLFSCGAALLALAVPFAAAAQSCVPTRAARPDPVLAATIQETNAAMAAARKAGDAAALMRHFAPDSLIMPEHQARLFGSEEGERYYRALFSTLRVHEYSQVTADILPLDGGALEWGTFELAFTPANGGSAEHVAGKYMQLWQRQEDGALKLQAEVWGFLAPLGESAEHWLVNAPTSTPPPLVGDKALGAELAALNTAHGEAVRSHDSSRIDLYAHDAVFLPFADAPQVGLAAIRAHLLPYIERGRGATFEVVRLWNDGFENVGGYVVEYPNFEVHWRAGDASGVTSGGGLRLWRRESDCSLKMIREAGIHHRP